MYQFENHEEFYYQNVALDCQWHAWAILNVENNNVRKLR